MSPQTAHVGHHMVDNSFGGLSREIILWIVLAMAEQTIGLWSAARHHRQGGMATRPWESLLEDMRAGSNESEIQGPVIQPLLEARVL